MKRCNHVPVDLFDKPPQGDVDKAVLHFLCPYTRRHKWVICKNCGTTGYWGGYGFKRRVRWGYGTDHVLQVAEQHNRQMRGERMPEHV